MDVPFQRKGEISNTKVGRDFEEITRAFFGRQNINLLPSFSIPIGLSPENLKPHKFDLGSKKARIIVECKSHRWTETGNVPVAKMTTWDQVMFFFFLVPDDFRKVMFVLRDFNSKRRESLAEYYIRTNSHLIPQGVEFWEYDGLTNLAVLIPIRNR